MTCSLLVFRRWVFVLGDHVGSTASVSISFIYFWSFMCLNYNAWQVISQSNWSKGWLTRNEEKMRVSSVGGKATIGQDSLRNAENTSNRGGRELVTDGVRGCHSLGGPSAAISKTELFLVPVQTKMSHGCPCFQCLWACLVGGWSPLVVSAGSSRRGLYSCVSLIPCLPFHRVCLLEHSAGLTLLLITHLWIDLHPETFEHRTDKCCIHCHSYTGLFSFPQASVAHFYLAYLRGDLDENPWGKFIPLVTLRDAVLLYFCSKWQSKGAGNGVAS